MRWSLQKLIQSGSSTNSIARKTQRSHRASMQPTSSRGFRNRRSRLPPMATSMKTRSCKAAHIYPAQCRIRILNQNHHASYRSYSLVRRTWKVGRPLPMSSKMDSIDPQNSWNRCESNLSIHLYHSCLQCSSDCLAGPECIDRRVP